jgi:hypothetical protein
MILCQRVSQFPSAKAVAWGGNGDRTAQPRSLQGRLHPTGPDLNPVACPPGFRLCRALSLFHSPGPSLPWAQGTSRLSPVDCLESPVDCPPSMRLQYTHEPQYRRRWGLLEYVS